MSDSLGTSNEMGAGGLGLIPTWSLPPPPTPISYWRAGVDWETPPISPTLRLRPLPGKINQGWLAIGGHMNMMTVAF